MFLPIIAGTHLIWIVQLNDFLMYICIVDALGCYSNTNTFTGLSMSIQYEVTFIHIHSHSFTLIRIHSHSFTYIFPCYFWCFWFIRLFVWFVDFHSHCCIWSLIIFVLTHSFCNILHSVRRARKKFSYEKNMMLSMM